eukprot:139757_1
MFKINEPFNRPKWDNTQRNSDGTCYGEVQVLDVGFYAVWCRSLTPTKPCKVYIDIKRSILWMDCGCHSIEKFKRCSKNLIHANIDECIANVTRLLSYASIGYQKIVTHQELNEYFFTGNKKDCRFLDSTLIEKTLKCKNCQLVLCKSVSVHAARYLNSGVPFSERTQFAKMVFVYIYGTLFSYCFSHAHTASFILSDKSHVITLLEFIAFGLTELCKFHRESKIDEKWDAIIFKITFDAFTNCFILILKHWSKGNYLLRKYIRTQDEITHALFLATSEIINHFINQLHNCNRDIYLLKKCNDRNENLKVIDSKLILPLITFWQLLHHNKCRFGEWSYNSKLHQYLLLKHKDGLKHFININCKYTKINEKKLKWKYVTCQWYKCNNSKINLIKRNKTKKWKKCSGCLLARYCSKKCQKLDWNKGFHKRLCG